MDRCSSANRERFQFFVLLRIAFIEHAAVMSIEHWALCNASDRFEFDFNQFAIRAVIFFLWSASNFPLECGYLCVCCANCSGTASARCKCANLFDTIKFARAFFFFHPPPSTLCRCFYPRRMRFDVYLWRAFFCSHLPIRWPHQFLFSATRNFAFVWILFGIVRPVAFFWYEYLYHSVRGSCWRCTFQKHIFKMPFFVSPNFWYGWRRLQPRRRPAHSNTNEKRSQSERREKKIEAKWMRLQWKLLWARKKHRAHTHTHTIANGLNCRRRRAIRFESIELWHRHKPMGCSRTQIMPRQGGQHQNQNQK